MNRNRTAELTADALSKIQRAHAVDVIPILKTWLYTQRAMCSVMSDRAEAARICRASRKAYDRAGREWFVAKTADRARQLRDAGDARAATIAVALSCCVAVNAKTSTIATLYREAGEMIEGGATNATA